MKATAKGVSDPYPTLPFQNEYPLSFMEIYLNLSPFLTLPVRVFCASKKIKYQMIYFYEFGTMKEKKIQA